jgi:cytochrome P450/NADPH-cytochrome P450 reductase
LTNAVGLSTVEARVQACRDLQPPGSSKQTRHLEVSLPPGVAYQVGDHLGFCPMNDRDQVERLADRLGVALDGLFTVPKTMNVRAVPKGVVLQVRNVLTSMVDITGRPTTAIIDLLLDRVTDQAEWSKLMQIKDVVQAPDGPAAPLRPAIDAGGYDMLSLLDEFTSCRLNIYDFLQVAQPLKPRYYSTSSSPRVHGNGVAHRQSRSKPRLFQAWLVASSGGMSSRYVMAFGEATGSMSSTTADGFHAGRRDEADDLRLRRNWLRAYAAFLWDRLAMRRAGVAMAEAALFNGIRSANQDFIYKDEVEQFTAEGVLDHVHIAASRERPGHRDYVQDRLREHGALLWRLLSAGGYVYVCGSQPMREAVRTAVADVVATMDHAPGARPLATWRRLYGTAQTSIDVDRGPSGPDLETAWTFWP